ncbi:hypothetical protein ACNKHV_09365 [Shigella flexneri]
MVDFSHGKLPEAAPTRQLEVCEDICQQIRNGSTAIAGVMAVSFPARRNAKNRRRSAVMTYGQSITDPCLGWEILIAWSKNSPLR